MKNSDRIELEKLFEQYAPEKWNRIPRALKPLIIKFLNKIVALDVINKFLAEHPSVKSFHFIDEALEFLDASFLVSSKELERIPSTGRLVCISNHPLGGLDALVILKALHEVRSDVKIVANNVLMTLESLSDLFLPIDVFTPSKAKSDINRIEEALTREEAVVFFPAGEVSRLSLSGIKDCKWKLGAVRFAQNHKAPILPMYVCSKNSALFYVASIIAKSFSTLLLPRELLRKNKKPVRLQIGEVIPHNAFAQLHSKAATKLLRKQVESLPLGRKGPFRTERGIARPLEKRVLRKELDSSIFIGSPAPQKRLFLATSKEAPSILREIARLREITFRSVGEGTGKRLDKDWYDHHYKHLVLWDDEQLEIVGSYRLGFCAEIIHQYGIEGLYTSSLFSFSEEFINKLPLSVELGRSFIQKPYWNSHALEYLWAGIGSIISNEPNIQYLFGPVSISGSYSKETKAAMVYVCTKWFGVRKGYVTSKNRYEIPIGQLSDLQEYFCGTTYREDLNKLKLRLRANGVSIPTLIRQYSELCSQEGVLFCDFGVDESFNSCIDGLIQLDLNHLTAEKYQRYIEQYKSVLNYKCRSKEMQNSVAIPL